MNEFLRLARRMATNPLNSILLLLLFLLIISSNSINKSISTYYPTGVISIASPACGKSYLVDDSFVSKGWWPGENWGRWSRNGESDLFFRAPAEKFTLTFSLQKVSEKTLFSYKENNKNVKNSSTGNQVNLVFHDYDPGEIITLNFETKNAIPPFLVDSNNPDFRSLGVGISQIFFDCPA